MTLGQAVVRTFTISNGGLANLNLTGSPLVAITGPAAADFSLVGLPTTPIAPNNTTTFHIQFSPSLTGTRVATLTIANDDSDENPYDFALQGLGTVGVASTNLYLPIRIKMPQKHPPDPALQWPVISFHCKPNPGGLAGYEWRAIAP